MRVSLELLHVGHCRHLERIARRHGRWQPISFPAVCGLIVHPREGAILYDTGYASHFDTATEPFPERLYRWVTPPHLAPHEQLGAQLAKFGIRLADIRWCLVSHFHADHVAGLRDLPNARFLCMRADHAALRATTRWAGVRHGLLPSLLPRDFDDRVTFAEDLPQVALAPPWNAFGHGHDLFGDGSLVAVPLPGHTPAQMGLRLRDSHDRDVLLCADACWSHHAWRNRDLPAWPARMLMHDWQAYVTTIDHLGGLARIAPDVLIVPSHCNESVAAYRQSPVGSPTGGDG